MTATLVKEGNEHRHWGPKGGERLRQSMTVSAFGPSFRRQDPALLSAADSLTCVVAHVILRSPETYVVKEKLVKNGAWEAGDRLYLREMENVGRESADGRETILHFFTSFLIAVSVSFVHSICLTYPYHRMAHDCLPSSLALLSQGLMGAAD